jgi:Uma2 family endonuclease
MNESDRKSEYIEHPVFFDEFHDLQSELLSRTLQIKNYAPEEFFVGTNLKLYYHVHHALWHIRPDWFLVVEVPRLAGQELRLNFVRWLERRRPLVVVELLSLRHEKEEVGIYAESETDTESTVQSISSQELSSSKSRRLVFKGDVPSSKWEVYEEILRVPYYIVYNRSTNRVRFFVLSGGLYEERLVDNENPRIWITALEIGLGLWYGEFAGFTGSWLRWYDAEGNWLPTDTEQERAEKEQALMQLEQERIKAEQAVQKLLQVAQNLLQTGMSAEQVSQLTGLPETEVLSLTCRE